MQYAYRHGRPVPQAKPHTAQAGAIWNVALLIETVRERFQREVAYDEWNRGAFTSMGRVDATHRTLRLIGKLWEQHEAGEKSQSFSRYTPMFRDYAMAILFPGELTPEEEARAEAELERITTPLLNGTMPDGSPASKEAIIAYANALADKRLPLVRALHYAQPGQFEKLPIGEVRAALADLPEAAAMETVKRVYLDQIASGAIRG